VTPDRCPGGVLWLGYVRLRAGRHGQGMGRRSARRGGRPLWKGTPHGCRSARTRRTVKSVC